MTTLVFVCTGNICRSPMAEGLLKARLSPEEDIKVLSAGLAAADGAPPSENATAVMNELDIDISGQTSQLLTAELVDQADFLFVMTYSHLDHILMLYPQASEKTFLVRQFLEDETLLHRDISDPIGQSRDVYRRCRDEIRDALDSVLDYVREKE